MKKEASVMQKIQTMTKTTDEESDPISLLNFLAHICSFHFTKLDDTYRADIIVTIGLSGRLDWPLEYSLKSFQLQRL